MYVTYADYWYHLLHAWMLMSSFSVLNLDLVCSQVVAHTCDLSSPGVETGGVDHSLGYVPRLFSGKFEHVFIITPLSLMPQQCSPPTHGLHSEGFCLGVCTDLATLGSVVGVFESHSIWFSSISLYYLSPWWLFLKTSVQSWHIMSQTKKMLINFKERPMGHKSKSSKSVSWMKVKLCDHFLWWKSCENTYSLKTLDIL